MTRVVVACLILAASAVAAADPPSQYAFRAFTSEQGLGNPAVNAFAQTADGLLWMGSEDGLYRYDGARFRRLDVEDGLPANEVLSLMASPRGLWVGTRTGLVLVVDGDHVERDAAPGLPADQVNALTAAPDGSVWAATDSGVFHQHGERFLRAAGAPAGSSYALWVAPTGLVVAGNGGDLAIASSPGQWRTLGADAGLGRDRIDDIAATPDGVVWVKSARHLWSCDHAVTVCKEHSAELPDVSEIGRLLVDRTGRLQVATRSGVARRLGPARWDLRGPAQARSVKAVFEDREGSLWLTADTVYQLLGSERWRSYSPLHGFPAETAWSVRRDAAGALWVGTNRGVVHAVGDAWVTFPGTEPYTIQTIVDAGTALYVAGNEPWVMRLDLATRTTSVIGPGEAFRTDGIKSMLQLDGELWAASWNAGLLRMRETAGQHVWQRESVPGGDATEDFSQVLLDKHRRLWATGTNGLAVRDGGTWHRFTQADGLSATAVDYVIERASGELCIAYAEGYGVTCFRYGAGRLTDLRHLTRATGLTTDKAYTLGEDRAGRLYIGQGVGLDIVMGDLIEHFSSATGMVGDDCTARSFFADANGDIMIGTTRGLARFAASQYEEPPPPVAPLILGLTFEGARGPTRGRAVAPQDGATSLDIAFATPTFANRTRLVQQVRLLPLEQNWRDAVSGLAHYAKLPAGNYTFEVRARTAGDRHGPVASVAITIPPAWWQRTWFLGLVALAAIAVVIATIRWRSRILGARASARLVARSEASFRHLIEQSPDAVLVHRDGIVIYANARTLRFLGIADASELVGTSLQERLDLPEVDAGTEHETLMRRPDGSTLLVAVTAIGIDFAGAPAILAIARDCTERKALEARLMSADRLASIGTLAAGIAHEINNPLAYVKANLAVITEELGEHASPALRSAVADALDGAARVQDIVHGVNTFSRMEDRSREVIEITHAIELALRLTAKQLSQRCRVVRDFGPVPAVVGNESQLGQVFINLLVNAAHACDAPDLDANTIYLLTRTDASGRAVVEVRDTGRGMTPEVQRRIFEPFFTTKDVGEGTGLGLSICHGIIVALGGEISVTSEPGAGSTFRVVLPGAERVAAPPARPPTQPNPPSAPSVPSVADRLRVLVIDDDVKLLKSIGRMLSKHHDVTLEASSVDALARFDAGDRFDVVLSDLMMPVVTGMDLYAQLAVSAPEQARRMLFMTGGAFTPEAREFLDQDAIRSLEKPFDMTELRRHVDRIASGATSPGTPRTP